MNDYQKFIALSRYARWLPEENRRETWGETVERYMKNVVDGNVDLETAIDLNEAILNLDVMPSMRAMMTAGPALERDNTCAYNCSYLPVDDPKSFDEAMFILLCGTGVGFSVERQYVSKLPEVPEQLFNSETTIVVKDSKEGWAKGWDLDEAIKRVHENNMGRMLQPDGTIKRREDGKVVKNPEFPKVDLSDLV